MATDYCLGKGGGQRVPFKTDEPGSKCLRKGELKGSIKGINTKATNRSKIQTKF